jgi:formylglycine-generating enzyme required for sulfatase activity
MKPLLATLLALAWSALAADAQEPGTRFRDCAQCPEMVVVPAGRYLMGSPAGEFGRDADEGPQREVTIARPLAVGRFEVTFDQWEACLKDGGCNGYRPSDDRFGRENRPVIYVNWHDAKAYVTWLARHTGKPYRLLTEAEWEYIARAGTTTAWQCGNEFECVRTRAWFGGNSGGFTHVGGEVPANGFGLSDVMGNVWEWVEDCYRDSYAGAPTDGTAVTSGDCGQRVMRGGSWLTNPRELRSAYRSRDTVERRRNSYSLRVARALD